MWLLAAMAVGIGLALLGWGLYGDRPRGRRRCTRCWYDMAGAPSLQCPECGRDAGPRGPRALARTRRRWRVVLIGAMLAVASALAVVVDFAWRRGWAGAPRVVVIYVAPWADKTQPARPVSFSPPGSSYFEVLYSIVWNPMSDWERNLLASRLQRTLHRTRAPEQRQAAASFILSAHLSGNRMDDCIPALWIAISKQESGRGSIGWALQQLTSADTAYIRNWMDLALTHRDPDVRALTAEVLSGHAHQGHVGPINVLISLLRDPDEGVACRAALGLPTFAAVNAIQPLIELLRADDPVRIWSAAHVLGRFGPSAAEAVPALHTRLSDPALQDEERIEIVRALLAIEGEASLMSDP